MNRWRWDRLGWLVAGAIGGLWLGWASLADETPRWITAMSGVLLLIGIGCTFALLLLTWEIVTEDIRPRIMARKPGLPLALTTELGVLKGSGKRRFNQHPVRFWAGMTLNHRVFVGVLLFRETEEVTFTTEVTHDRG